jgi:hypothetical protein
MFQNGVARRSFRQACSDGLLSAPAKKTKTKTGNIRWEIGVADCADEKSWFKD